MVLTGDDVETARFFPDVRLNYAEALLRPLPGVDDDAPALTAVHADRPAEHLQPRASCAPRSSGRPPRWPGSGVRAGERVVRSRRTPPASSVAALAGAAAGADVSTATPDMGAAALLGRFEQVEPTSWSSTGRRWPSRDGVRH